MTYENKNLIETIIGSGEPISQSRIEPEDLEDYVCEYCLGEGVLHSPAYCDGFDIVDEGEVPCICTKNNE